MDHLDKIVTDVSDRLDEAKEIANKLNPILINHQVKAIAFFMLQVRETIQVLNPGIWEECEKMYELLRESKILVRNDEEPMQ